MSKPIGKMPVIKGWGLPLQARKEHYFINGMAACRQWMFTGALLEKPPILKEEACTTCLSRYEKGITNV